MTAIPPRSHLATVVPQAPDVRLEIMRAARTFAAQKEDEWFRRRRSEIASIRCELEAIPLEFRRFHRELSFLVRSELRKAGFSPDEPRVPGGNPDAGQWTREDGGAPEAANVTPVAMTGKPGEKPELPGGFGGGGGGAPTSPDVQPELPFPRGLPPQLAPYVP